MDGRGKIHDRLGWSEFGSGAEVAATPIDIHYAAVRACCIPPSVRALQEKRNI